MHWLRAKKRLPIICLVVVLNMSRSQDPPTAAEGSKCSGKQHPHLGTPLHCWLSHRRPHVLAAGWRRACAAAREPAQKGGDDRSVAGSTWLALPSPRHPLHACHPPTPSSAAKAKIQACRCRHHLKPCSPASLPARQELQVPTDPPAWAEAFADPGRPLVLDIGCGYGRFLLALR